MFKKSLQKVLGISLVGAAALLILISQVRNDDEQSFDEATVIYVIDGDTVILEIDGVEENVRLIGIDAPETGKGDQPLECFGNESTDFLRKLLPKGSKVKIVRDQTPRDRFKRLLLYLYKTDNTFINYEIAAQGYADVRSYGDNTTKQSELYQALDEAKNNNKGIWANC